MEAVTPIKIAVLVRVFRVWVSGFLKVSFEEEEEEEEEEEAFGILRGGVEVELWDLRVVKWRSEGELKEEGVLRWRREVARVKFMVGGDTGRILKRDGFRGSGF
jgi:hypothetical protein